VGARIHKLHDFFVIVVMCGATTNKFFVFLMVISCQCMKLFVLCGCVDMGKNQQRYTLVVDWRMI
jgi:hypothetical protein